MGREERKRGLANMAERQWTHDELKGRLEFVFTDLLTCSREPLMNQQLWPGDHTLSGHPQFQQNEFQPTCRSHSATPSMSRLIASEHTQLQARPHGTCFA